MTPSMKFTVAGKGKGTTDRQRNTFERSGGQMRNILQMQTMQTGKETVAGVAFTGGTIPPQNNCEPRFLRN